MINKISNKIGLKYNSCKRLILIYNIVYNICIKININLTFV